MKVAFLSTVVLTIAASGSAAGRQPAQREPAEHGTKRADGLQATLLSAPPLSSAEMQKGMPGMGGMRGMQGRGGMSGGMGSMGEMSGMAGEAPTHWIGIAERDVKLMPMPGSYGANISLSQRGQYAVTVGVVRAGQPQTVAFDFDYR